MKKIGLGLLLAGFALPALAADLPAVRKAENYVTRNFDWTGFYLGVGGGYGATTTEDLDMKGGFAGGQVGYNFQTGNLVLGVEGDFHWANIERTIGVGIADASATIQSFGTVRGRVGFAADQFMLYGTGGVAFANNKLSAGVPGFTLSDAQWHVGWTAGAGVEVAFNRNWSGKVEYLYSGFSSADYFNGTIASGEVELSTVKVGVNYRFN